MFKQLRSGIRISEAKTLVASTVLWLRKSCCSPRRPLSCSRPWSPALWSWLSLDTPEQSSLLSWISNMRTYPGEISTTWDKIKKEGNVKAGLYFGPKTIFPPPSENDIFPTSCDKPFNSYCALFCLNSSLFWIYFTLLLPIFSFSFLFLLFFLWNFPPFSLLLSKFFLQMTLADISPPSGGGGGVFSNI